MNCEDCAHEKVCEGYSNCEEVGLCEPKRPHGEWKVYSHCSDGFSYKCSLCGRVVNSGYWFEQKEILRVYPYCHCGAKMTSVADPIKWYLSLGKKEGGER